ncbi:MAG: serine/threonine-protein kinase, partial [Myxococcota bacterium]
MPGPPATFQTSPAPAPDRAPPSVPEERLDALERIRARLGQLVGGLLAVVAGVSALIASPTTGGALLVIALAAIGFYTAILSLLSGAAGPIRPWMRWASPPFEVLVPTAITWLLTRTEGPASAAASWVPAQLYAVFVVASALRLQPSLPIAMGVGSAAAYGAVYLSTMAPAADLSVPPVAQGMRVAVLVAIGVAASFTAARLRTAVGEIERSAREQGLFGKYRLGAEIGFGGMGRVLEAEYAPEGGFSRKVAIKVLHPHLARDPAFVDRFRAEAEIASRLTHPNFVAGLDYGRVDQTWYLALEHVDGKPLSQLMNERRRVDKPLDPRIVAAIGRQIAAALDWAHTGVRDDQYRPLRIVHRDLSPSNILIDRAGRVRITDFGVARAMRDAGSVISKNLVGKPAYVAPEALRDQGVDPRADLWSLGVILWEAVTNVRLFARDTDAAALLAVVEADIEPPSRVRPGLPPAWDELLGRLLVRDRDQRTLGAAGVRVLLEAIAAAAGDTELGPIAEKDLRELLAPEEGLEELVLDATSEEAEPPWLELEPETELDRSEPQSEEAGLWLDDAVADQPLVRPPRPSPDATSTEVGSPER